MVIAGRGGWRKMKNMLPSPSVYLPTMETVSSLCILTHTYMPKWHIVVCERHPNNSLCTQLSCQPRLLLSPSHRLGSFAPIIFHFLFHQLKCVLCVCGMSNAFANLFMTCKTKSINSIRVHHVCERTPYPTRVHFSNEK